MNLLKSTIGLKIVMALTGIVLFGFVIGHMLGNLQIFLGADVLNDYAALLHETAPLLWGTRIVLLLSVFGHIYSAVVLSKRSMAARPSAYKEKKWMGSSYAVRTMRWGGVILLLFIVYHLLHFTVGVSVEPVFTKAVTCSDQSGSMDCGEVYSNVIRAFTNPFVALFYIVAQGALGLHLAHGLWSLCRTLGMQSESNSIMAKRASVAFGTLITVGNCSIPIAVLFGFLS